MKILQLSRNTFPCICLSFSFRRSVHSSETHSSLPISITLSFQWIHEVAALCIFFQSLSWDWNILSKVRCSQTHLLRTNVSGSGGRISSGPASCTLLGGMAPSSLPFSPPLNSPTPLPFLHCFNTSHCAHCYLPSSVRAETHPSPVPTWPMHLPCSSSKVCCVHTQDQSPCTTWKGFMHHQQRVQCGFGN